MLLCPPTLGLLLPDEADPGNIHFLGIAGLEFAPELIVGDFRGEGVGEGTLLDRPGDGLRRAVECQHVFRLRSLGGFLRFGTRLLRRHGLWRRWFGVPATSVECG